MSEAQAGAAGAWSGASQPVVISVTPASETRSSAERASYHLDIRQVRELPAREATLSAWPDWLAVGSPVRTAVEGMGVAQLWEHQAVAAEALFAGRNVVLTTGTASGKSLAYLLPIAASAIGSGRLGSGPRGSGPLGSGRLGSGPLGSGPLGSGAPAGEAPVRRRRPATSLYLAPTKALAHDQARVCSELAVPGWRIATVDGDTDPADRQWARDHAHHVLTNPDLLHASLLPNHARWASFLRSLRYVVVDESHRYRGVFGAQVAAVLRRLRRIASHYRAEPSFAVLSATAPEPLSTASELTGVLREDLGLVDLDASPRARVRISLAASDAPAETVAAHELAARVRRGQQVLAFVPSRRAAEEVARAAAAEARTTAGEIVAYRAGYLAADRRLIERGLAEGRVRGVAATNALELGVDITGLDAVLLCGYPGSRAAFWQQAGRAGRRGTSAEVMLIARPSPLDAYLLDHPGVLFDEPVETSVLDAASPSVLGPQLAAAAQELPLRPGDERWFGTRMWSLVARLTDRGLLRRRPDGWYWTAPRRAVDRINLRSADARTTDIVEAATGRVLGTVGASTADLVVHPGAVYVHQGETYLCDQVHGGSQAGGPLVDEPLVGNRLVGDPPGGDPLDGDPLDGDSLDADSLDGDQDGNQSDGNQADADGTDGGALEAYVRAARPGYLTQPLTEVDVRLGSPELERRLSHGRIAYGSARVISKVTGFLRRDELTGQVWDSTPLDCPERVLATAAAVLTVPIDVLGGGRGRGDAGVHALEHLLAGLLPAIVANDRSDVGARSWLQEDRAGVVAVFDQQPGSGFASRAYARADVWLATARERIVECSCDTGCPACILVPGCSSTRPLDKAGARHLLDELVPNGSAAPQEGASVASGGETGP